MLPNWINKLKFGELIESIVSYICVGTAGGRGEGDGNLLIEVICFYRSIKESNKNIFNVNYTSITQRHLSEVEVVKMVTLIEEDCVLQNLPLVALGEDSKRLMTTTDGQTKVEKARQRL